MTLVVVFAVGAAVINVATGRVAKRFGRGKDIGRYGWTQGLALLLRFIVFFATAHAVFGLRHSAADVTVYIFVAAVLQLAGQSYFLLRDDRLEKGDGSGE